MRSEITIGLLIAAFCIYGTTGWTQEEATEAQTETVEVQEEVVEPQAKVPQLSRATPVREPKTFDGFEYDQNLFRGRSGQYMESPSRVFATRTAEQAHVGKKSLKLKYDKKGTGGKYGMGGWCGYWSHLKKGSQYFDASPYSKLTFWVKGEEGGENFRIGIADMHWDKLQDSVKSGDVTDYLSSGQITTDWQKVVIPLDVWFVDLKQLASFAVCFESDNYPGGEQAGVVFIDDVQFE